MRSQHLSEIARLLHTVRTRLRLRRLTWRLAWFVTATASVALAAAAVMDAWQYAPALVITARAVSYFIVAVALGALLGIPLLPGVSDARLALYVEEREPALAKIGRAHV